MVRGGGGVGLIAQSLILNYKHNMALFPPLLRKILLKTRKGRGSGKSKYQILTSQGNLKITIDHSK